MAKTKAKKWYAIKMVDGEEKNLIVNSWTECSQMVLHHKAVYKSFPTQEEAESYLQMNRKEAEVKAERMAYCIEKKKDEKKKYRNYSIRIPMELAKLFDDKLGKMGYTPSQVMADYVREWVE